MHFASFDSGDPLFDAFGLRLSAQLVTLENLYGIDPAHARVETSADRVRIVAGGLRGAGGQLAAPGSFELIVEEAARDVLRLRAVATAGAPIRCVKLLLRDLDPSLEVSTDGAGFARGRRARRRLRLPDAHPDAAAVGAQRRRDVGPARRGRPRAREALRALARAHRRARGPRLHRADPRGIGAALRGVDRDAGLRRRPRGAADVAEAEHVAWIERAFGLAPFAERRDVPAWARELRLVAVLHGMHWSGRVFLDYAAMLEVLRFVAERIDGRHVLAYLPGWEGRYYWQYGDYRPEPRLGGERGFAALCDGARALGVHLMPMFGANCVNALLPRFARSRPRAPT